MKKIHFIIILGFALILSFCKKEGMEFDNNGGQGLSFVHFVGNTTAIAAIADSVPTHSAKITVSSSVLSDKDRTYTLVVVDSSSTAVEGKDYNISSKTVTIPANQYSGSVTITVNVDNLTLDPVYAKFTINSEEAIDYGKNMTVSMQLRCPFDPSMLVGDFDYNSDDWGETGSGAMVADAKDPYTIYFDMAQAEGLSGNGNKVKLIVNPDDLSISGPNVIISDDLSEWGLPYTNYAFLPVSGVYDACADTYTITFAITVSQGSFGNNVFIFTRAK